MNWRPSMWPGFVSVYFVDFSQPMHCPKLQSSSPMPQVLDSGGHRWNSKSYFFWFTSGSLHQAEEHAGQSPCRIQSFVAPRRRFLYKQSMLGACPICVIVLPVNSSRIGSHKISYWVLCCTRSSQHSAKLALSEGSTSCQDGI